MWFDLITKHKLKQLAGDIIYARGEDYFKNKDVIKIWFEDDRILARVAGTRGEYKVEIEEQNNKLSWQCNCPYDGSICKHVIAAGLEFFNKKDEIIKQAQQTNSQHQNLKEKLLELDKKDLAELLINSLKTHSNWKNVFLKKVAEKLDQIGKGNDNQEIYKEEFFSHFDRTCEIIEEFNQYGGGPDEDDDEAYEELKQVIALFKENKLSQKLKNEFFDKMFFYYDLGNSGMDDMIIDAVFEVANQDEDWHYIIKKLKTNKNKEDNSYQQGMIIDIYRDHLNDEEKYLELRQNELKWGGDYYDLVDFWDKKGEKEKAVEIAKQGIQKCEHGLTDLYEYLFKYYQKKDYKQALNYLKQIYEEYSGFENYKRLKKFVKQDDWFKINEWCCQLLKKKDSLYELAKIYEFNQEYDKVLAYVLIVPKDRWGGWDYGNKDEFADKLLTKYPQELIPYYENKIIRNIENKTRESYQIAANYAKKLKQIYLEYLDQKNEWQKYINNIRSKYAKFPALIDEFKKL
ncbi:MAG: SWIM zinc finger family protein [Candidatus Kuenenbacteria bacterium]